MLLKIVNSYKRKFKAYSLGDHQIYDVKSICFGGDKLTGVIKFGDKGFIVNFDDEHLFLHEYTGLNYIDDREAYDGDIFRDKQHGDLFRIYRIEGGFAISVNSFSSTFTGESLYPLSPLADAQTTSWFLGSAEYVSNIHEFISPESYI
jgi:hypothetical protein